MFNKKLDTILGAFNKVTQELEAFVTSKLAENAKLGNEIAVKNAILIANDEDIGRAERTKLKIQELVN